MNAVAYDFDDVINIVNERHESIRFNEHVKHAYQMEKDRLYKERIHDLNKVILRWCANAGYFFAGGSFMSVVFCAIMKFYALAGLGVAVAAVATACAVVIEKKWGQF